MPNSNNYPAILTNNLTATIASSASLSGPVNMQGTTLVGYVMPAAWDTADITFQASVDGSTFVDVSNSFGFEISHSASASKFITVNPNELAAVQHLKIRSGSSASAVNQSAERVITLITRTI